ncbi:ribosome maturation factor RimP [Hufsiella ginkgonis]|uniref:Ribosome maturation factor RimP n=1 Tax=Hufsiella ginkgonis TaxID=2695274 RepID=A0A7K1XSW3_9SPHI|nr:ribosome assembly cofactor RimP [Hufsiella ginkgonis]MXV13958.1 ribosome assembly cofactor RimP [Hufsiella ginkgonis]
MNPEQRVRELAEERIADRNDLFIVDVKLGGGRLEILVDGDQGVKVQDCADISRHVGFHLEEENVIDHAYNLEVSSPGIDTPLKMERQYRKNEGRDLGIKQPDGTRREGKLLKVETDGILIEEKIKPAKAAGQKAQLVENFIPFGQITEAKVLISFK